MRTINSGKKGKMEIYTTVGPRNFYQIGIYNRIL